MAIPDQALWVLSFLFYISDNVQRIPTREMVLSEGWNGEWKVTLPLYRYELGGRIFTVTNPFLPWLTAVRMDWLTTNAFESSVVRRANKRLFVLRQRILEFRLISAVLFVVYFILAPYLTRHFGLAYALMIALPLHLVFLGILGMTLIAKRRNLGLHWWKILSLTIECAICPGYFVNICRRISMGYAQIPGDAIGVAAKYRQASSPEFCRRLDFYFEDLNQSGLASAADLEAINQYRVRLMK
jgi:hypothetical protein